MKPRSSLLVIVAIVAAFALGSAGTAVAGSALSKGTVKKIAAKVVKKAAPSLAVASAGNADKLDGLDSADLKTTTYRLTLPATAPASNQVLGLPGVPAGTYLASYDALLLSSTSSSVLCTLLPSLATPGVAVARAYSSQSASTASTASGSAVLTVGNQTVLQCGSAFSFQFTSGEITLTKIDTLSQGAATPVV